MAWSRRKGQGGYALLELTLAMLIASVLAAWGMQSLVNRIDDAEAQSAAVWMEAIYKAVVAYVRHHGTAIQSAAGPAVLSAQGFADWQRPTVQEFVHARFLSPGIPVATRLTGAARISVWRRGECPGDHCVVEALVHGERPLARSPGGSPDQAMIAQWLLAAQGNGAAVHADDPSRLRGAAFALSNVLPDGTVLPMGTVGMAVTAEHLPLWSYLRVRDPRDPDFQGGLSVQGDVLGGGDVALSGQLVIGAQGHDGEDCATDNAVVHEAEGGLLVCRLGRWRAASRGGGGGFAYNTLHGCAGADGVSTVNPLTGACSCPWYAVAVRFLDTGPRPYPEGRQYAYLCVG